MNTPTSDQLLFEKGLISDKQLEAIREYRSRNIFSLHNEIRAFLFISVMLFTTGAGISIYKNIDTIGHVFMLSLILAVALGCYYYSFKHAPGFSKSAVQSQKPLYDYLVLAASLLSGIFIAYLHYQYQIFGLHYDLATLVPVLLYFFSAYYFDHKGVLSLAITGLCAFVGFSASPTGLLHTQFNSQALAYYAIATAAVFIAWSLYAEKVQLKKHFNAVYQNFAMHILCIACITDLFYPNWLLPLLIIGAGAWYFVRLAYTIHSAYFFSFIFLYCFVAASIVIGKLIFIFDIIFPFIYISPLYLVGAILLFIKSLKQLKNKTRHDSI